MRLTRARSQMAEITMIMKKHRLQVSFKLRKIVGKLRLAPPSNFYSSIPRCFVLPPCTVISAPATGSRYFTLRYMLFIPLVELYVYYECILILRQNLAPHASLKRKFLSPKSYSLREGDNAVKTDHLYHFLFSLFFLRKSLN